MREVNSQNFGLLIAYLLPGLVALWGIAPYSGTLRAWLTVTAPNVPTIGGFLYGTMASVIAGLLVSTVRWLLIDQIHHLTGVPPPGWKFESLQDKLTAVELIIESHYRYYQFYANMMIAAATAYAGWRSLGLIKGPEFDACFVALECLLFLGSRDTLRKYYRRLEQLLQ